jgi:hypothetical protein
MQAKLRSRFSLVTMPALLITLTIFVFAPAMVFKGNMVEIGFNLADILAIYIIPSLGLFLMLVVIGFVFPEKVFRIYISLLLITGVLIWIQGSFLVWNYGQFDGNIIDWTKYRWQGFIDLFIWLIFITLAIIFRKSIIPVSYIICWSLIIIQGSFFILSVSVLKNNSPATKSDWNVPADLLNYSDSLNVIHFMLDNFQTDVFLEVVQENSFDSKLEGFTAFRENMANASTTVVSIPSIFSGDIYDGSVSVGNFFSKSISEKGFHHVLHQNGFRINFIPHIDMPRDGVTNYYTIPYLYGRTRDEECAYKATYLLDIVIFRSFPHFVKKIIYNGGNWRISPLFAQSPNQGLKSVFDFMKDYSKNIRIFGPLPAYHFIFLDPPHPPYMINKDGSFATEILSPTIGNYKIQAKYSLKLFIDFIDMLKQKKLYDKSLIILQSDHGSSFPPTKNGITMSIQRKRVPAMLAIKRPHETGKMKISDAQTMNADIAATILEILRIDNYSKRISVFSLDTMKNRNREFVTLTDHYDVVGSLYNIHSWRNGTSIKRLKVDTFYAWDSVISFGLMGNSEIYQITGWSTPINEEQWNDGKLSQMRMIINETHSDILLEATFTPFLPKGKLKQQRVSIRVNGNNVGEWVVNKNICQTCSILIPSRFIKGKIFNLDFLFPDATSPKSLNLSPDRKLLAIKMRNLILKSVKTN